MMRFLLITLAVVAAVAVIHPADTVEGRTRAMVPSVRRWRRRSMPPTTVVRPGGRWMPFAICTPGLRSIECTGLTGLRMVAND